MRPQWTRRGFLAAAGAAGVAVAASACSGKQADPGTDGGVVKITHAFGETTVATKPKRVVSAGLTEHDDLLALGVVPIAVTNWFGDQPLGVWSWAQPRLGGATPVVLNLDNGIQIDQIAALKPDLIVAINAGVDQDTYRRLSGVAPTIPQSGNEPFFESWKTQATTVAAAMSAADTMKTALDAVDAKFASVAKDNPEFAGKKIVLLQGTVIFEHSVSAIRSGWRTDFLTQMGFTIADSINDFARDDRSVIPLDKIGPALDAADLLVWQTQSDADVAALLADPSIAALKATREKRHVFTSKDLAGAIAFASPLSYPVVADQLPPLLKKALR